MHELAGRIGICFQNPATQLSMVSETVYEEVAFAALNLGYDRLDVARRTNEALDAVGITSSRSAIRGACRAASCSWSR